MKSSILQKGFTDKDIREDMGFFDAETASFDKHPDLPQERYELLTAIEYLAKLEDDWNGFSAQAPTDLSLTAATRFIECLPFNRVYPDKVSPNGEGGIIFTWKSSGERILLTIEGSLMHLSYEKSGEADIFADEILFNFSVIPAEVLMYMPLRKPRINASSH